MEMLQPVISVVICTRNRSASLRRTLESIGRMSIPAGVTWEVVVVDNGSTDDTPDVVRSLAPQSAYELRYVAESREGASQARNTGIRCAGGQVIAFIDDDMIVDPAWLASLVEESSKDLVVGIFFGRTQTLRPDQAKIAIREGDVEQTYVFPSPPREPGSSNNMVVRRSILDSVGGFDTALGPGTPCCAAEDIDLTYRVLRSGVSARYCPTIFAYHDHERSSPEAVRSLQIAYGIGAGAFYCKHVIRRDLWAAKLGYWEVCYFLKAVFRRGDTMRSLTHLTGFAAGFLKRLGVEIETRMKGDGPVQEMRDLTPSTRLP